MEMNPKSKLQMHLARNYFSQQWKIGRDKQRTNVLKTRLDQPVQLVESRIGPLFGLVVHKKSVNNRKNWLKTQ